MMRKLVCVPVLMFVLHFVTVKCHQPLAPALYVFGDSLLDSGNNNLLVTIIKADYAPYGFDFVDGPTGRFTNGKTPVDFIAELLGLPFAPPYLSFANKTKTLTGFNYASGGAGILHETSTRLGFVVPLSAQVDLFEKTLKGDQFKQFDSKGLSKYLSKSIFLVGIGSNDYINNYLQPILYDSSRRYSPEAFAQHLIQDLSQQLQRMYKLGARKILVFGLGAIGCLPHLIYSEPNNNGSCVDRVNKIVSIFNTQLRPQLTQLNSTLQGSFFAYIDTYTGALAKLQDPSKHGFSVVNRPCCVTVPNTLGCVPLWQPCSNRDQYFFYDGFHPTEAANGGIVKCFNHPQCSPVTIQQLVQI